MKQFKFVVLLLFAIYFAGCGEDGKKSEILDGDEEFTISLCSSDEQCDDGFFCADGFCVPETESEQVDGDLDAEISPDGDEQVEDGDDPEPSNRQGYCRYDFQCKTGELCIASRCTECECRSAEDCREDLNCVDCQCMEGSGECHNNVDCLPYEECNRQGFCESARECEENLDCREGYFCDQEVNQCKQYNVCVNEDGVEIAEACFNGQYCNQETGRCEKLSACESDNDCSELPEGLDYGTCYDYRCADLVCEYRNHCDDGEICENGECVPGNECEIDVDCVDGDPSTGDVCQDGRCVRADRADWHYCETDNDCSETNLPAECLTGNVRVYPSGVCVQEDHYCNILIEICEFGCSNGACNSQPECMSDQDCIESWICVPSSDGSQEAMLVHHMPNCVEGVCWVESQPCYYGCEEGECLPEPEPDGDEDIAEDGDEDITVDGDEDLVEDDDWEDGVLRVCASERFSQYEQVSLIYTLYEGGLQELDIPTQGNCFAHQVDLDDVWNARFRFDAHTGNNWIWPKPTIVSAEYRMEDCVIVVPPEDVRYSWDEWGYVLEFEDFTCHEPVEPDGDEDIAEDGDEDQHLPMSAPPNTLIACYPINEEGWKGYFSYFDMDGHSVIHDNIPINGKCFSHDLDLEQALSSVVYVQIHSTPNWNFNPSGIAPIKVIYGLQNGETIQAEVILDDRVDRGDYCEFD